MVRHLPVNSTASVVTLAHSPCYAAPIILTTRFTDVAMLTTVTANTVWGLSVLETTRESTPIMYASPV